MFQERPHADHKDVVSRTQNEEKKDNRRHARKPLDAAAKVHVVWQDEFGGSTQAVGRIADISITGARLVLPKRPDLLSSIRLRSEGQKLNGDAVVRHCDRGKIDYVVGLEFVGGLAYSRMQG